MVRPANLRVISVFELMSRDAASYSAHCDCPLLPEELEFAGQAAGAKPWRPCRVEFASGVLYRLMQMAGRGAGPLHKICIGSPLVFSRRCPSANQLIQ
jgi:hypothetical protein